MVLNLLTNALDSLDDGGTVRVELAARGGYAELTVTDNGCGMEPDVLEHVFEPFFTRRRGGQGTGWGCRSRYRIVADHGGDDRRPTAPGRARARRSACACRWQRNMTAIRHVTTELMQRIEIQLILSNEHTSPN